MNAGDANRLSSQEQVVTAAIRLGHGLADLASDIREVIEAEVPALRGSEGRGLLQSSVQQNVDAALTMLVHDIDTDRIDAPSAAVAYARQLAQRGVSRLALVRAYRVGQRRFLRRLFEEMLRHVDRSDELRAALDTVDRVSEYVDRVSEQLMLDYAEARKEWLDPNRIVADRVRSVLGDAELTEDEAQARIGGYRLELHHLGAILWSVRNRRANDDVRRLRRVSDAFGKAAGCESPPLYVPIDEATACVWFGFAEHRELSDDQCQGILRDELGIFVAVGEMNPALAGFRRTHQQALMSEAVARVQNPPLARVTWYVDVAPVATMSGDLNATRSWVLETLGALAIDDARHAGLRETVRLFFETGGSYAATAERLSLHRNTVQYRIRTAEDLRGRPFSEGRLDVELALSAAHWFGAAVLAPASAKQSG